MNLFNSIFSNYCVFCAFIVAVNTITIEIFPPLLGDGVHYEIKVKCNATNWNYKKYIVGSCKTKSQCTFDEHKYYLIRNTATGDDEFESRRICTRDQEDSYYYDIEVIKRDIASEV